MMKEGFILGALLGAGIGIMIYKNNTEAKKVIDEGEQMIKKHVKDCKKDLSKVMKKEG